MIERFLNGNFKGIMTYYYRKVYRKEIYKVLKFFYDYQQVKEGINIFEAIRIMTLDQDNWSMEKASKIVGICIYCGFLENNKNAKDVIINELNK